MNNPNYDNISEVPIEVMLREEIGDVISPDRLCDIPAAIEKLCDNPEIWQTRMRELRSRWVYNVGKSASVMAGHISRASKSSEPNLGDVQ